MDANKSNGQFPIPGIALILIALGIFAYNDNPFNPTRPENSSQISSAAEDVRARLWQDPFGAVEQHRKLFDSNLGDFSGPKVDSADGYTYQDKNHIVCVTKGETLNASNGAHTYAELGCQINNTVASDMHILAVMVPGGDYAEDIETRIRSRYAVVSALSKAEYIPGDPEHIGFMNFSNLCKSAIEHKPSNNDDNASPVDIYDFCNWPATIPYEWFVKKSKQGDDVVESKTLVLWVDDGVTAKNNPLEMLNKLRSRITQKLDADKRGYSFDVFGPASSTTLIKMYEEANSLTCVPGVDSSSQMDTTCNDPVIDDYKTYGIKIYSYKATMDDVGVNKYIKKRDGENTDWLKVIKTIPGDDELVEALLNELLRRGINPYKYVAEENKQAGLHGVDYCNHKLTGDFRAADACEDITGIELNRSKMQDHIVLIGEWDTVYSRNFNDLFRRNIEAKSNVEDVYWLHSYNYLRGIDGATTYKENSDKSAKSNNTGSQDEEKELRRPVGENQYDYLRNIGDQISHLNDSLAGSGAVRAIGIVGSDTYDKLLVLQALRERFQDIVFFTTDLDSRMLHKSENKWARNLVVASGFGLSPRDENQYEIATFRDGYQTSLYLSVLNAIGYSPEKMSDKHECNIKYGVVSDVFGNPVTAKIFEIGNSKAVDYSPRYFAKAESEYSLSSNHYIYAVLFIVLFSLIFYQASYPSRIILLITVSVMLGMAAIVWFGHAADSIEFNEIFSGTSIWPAILIRMAAAFLALVFILYTLKRMRENTREIIEKYDLKQPVRSCPVRIRDMIFIDTWCVNRSSSAVSVSELMCQYLNLAGFKRWFPRVLVMTVVFMAVSLGYMKTNGFPYTPFHGDISYSFNSTVIKVCVFMYIFLVFLVVDITRLYARFVKLLSQSNATWSKTLIDEYCQKYGVTENIAREKLKLNMIVQRSKSVDILIFLPFAILSLMIISRSSFFDRWYMSVDLAVIILLGACFALSSAIRLRRTAESARKEVLSTLEKLYKQQVYKEAKCELVKKTLVDEVKDLDVKELDGQFCEYKLASRLQRIIDEIRDIKDGPFSPITQHPIFSAIAMPFGGVGGLYLIDYISNLGM